MAHQCKALIVHCMDFRLAKSMRDYLESNNLLGDCDVVSIAGATKNLDFILTQIETSINLHGIQEVIISHHTGCGAYKEMSFNSFEEECEFQIGEMKKAKNLILGKYPNIKVTLLLAKILPSEEIELEEIS